jgi:hypothetical protein
MTDFSAAADFVALHARLLDRHRFAHLFLDGPTGPVLAALRAYRNPDGGFGHAIEPDLRGPMSQPAGVSTALEILVEVEAGDDPMVDASAGFLETITRPDGGVPFVLQSATEYPRAPWWQPADESSVIQTGFNAAMLYELGSRHPWLDGASEYMWARIEAQEILGGAYDARFAIAFLDAAPDAERATRALDALAPRLHESGLVATDPDAPGEVHSPLDFSPWPGSRSRRLFDDALIERHLDALAGRQKDDGGWTVNFPAWSAAAALEWRGIATVLALKLLRAHGRPLQA